MQVKNTAECSIGSILQYFDPVVIKIFVLSISYRLYAIAKQWTSSAPIMTPNKTFINVAAPGACLWQTVHYWAFSLFHYIKLSLFVSLFSLFLCNVKLN